MTGLEYFRRKNRMTITEVANAIGVSRQSVSQWEHDVCNIPKRRVKELAKLFSTDAENIIKKYADTNMKNQTGMTGLEYYRRLHNMSLADVAKELDITKASVRRWEKRWRLYLILSLMILIKNLLKLTK